MFIAVHELHDGFVKSLSVDGTLAVLVLESEGGCRFDLRLEEVEALHAEDFQQLNIIYSLEIVCATAPPWVDQTQLLETLFPGSKGSVAIQHHHRHADRLQNILNRISTGDATMVVLRGTLGCDLVAVCRTAQLTRLGMSGTTEPGTPHLMPTLEVP